MMTSLKIKEQSAENPRVCNISKEMKNSVNTVDVANDKKVSSFGHVCGKVSKTSIEEELFFQIYQSLHKHNLKSHAFKISKEITRKLLQVWGGCQMYFPKHDALEVQEKYEKIYQDFTGKNHRKLAEKYNYSLPTIYRIISTMSKEHQCDCLKKIIDQNW